ncbi:TonB-dependent receptor [Novosphingobium sp. FKTRR1]|uniref:TonB-dependent receptor n=1 Tax=Novosphingobium sp. FKTRR1 TaxID=2879118 RepID=UPI001CEFF1AF|nr:TonB-dependent receptor [Novosphingobium sp. FKTRR1]
MTTKTIVRASLLAGVAVCLFGSVPAMAADAPAAPAAPEAEAPVDEIVVTATKRETNLQDTPISMAVLGNEALKERHVQSLIDLGDGAIPSLRISTFEARQSALTIGIRGIVPGDANQPAREQGVGVYIDGVYLGRQHGLNASLFDVERIEVLKGPQGTLFGRNTEGGALSIVTKAPTGEFGGRVTAGIGNYGQYNSQLHLDLPAIANIAFKIDGVIQHQDPTIKNPLAGQAGWNQYHRYGGRVTARWKPVDGLTVDLSFDKSRDENTPFYSQLVTVNPSVLPKLPSIIDYGYGRATSADIGVPQQPSVDKTQGFTSTIKYKVSPALELRSITAWRTVSDEQWDNSGGAHRTPVFKANTAFSRYSLSNLDQRQFSQELQAVGSFDKIDYVAGLYYFSERANDAARTPNTNLWNATLTGYSIIDPSTYVSATVARASIAYAKSYAAYGQATYSPIDPLHITLGGRYTKDKKNGTLFTVNGAATNFTFDQSNSRFDPLAIVAFDVTRDVNVYAKYSTGYRAGGASSRSLNYRQFGPESVKSYEVGIKSEFLDRKVRLNLAGYIMDRKDSQVDFNFFIPQPNGTIRNTLETVNAAGITKIRGLEADLTVKPINSVSLGLSYAYTYTRVPAAENTVQEALNGDGKPVFQDVFIVFTPKNALSGTFDYKLPVGGAGAEVRLHLDGNYSDPMYTFDNEPVKSDKSFIVNARLSLADIQMSNGGQKLTVSAWARNLFNEAHIYRRSAANAATLGDYANYNAARTYGVDATVSF